MTHNLRICRAKLSKSVICQALYRILVGSNAVVIKELQLLENDVECLASGID